MSKDLTTTTDLDGFSDLANRSKELVEILSDNIGDDAIRPFDLDRITIPSAGSEYWMIPGLSKSKPELELSGVILAWRNTRSYWSKKLGDGQKGPPDCTSDDGKIGHGNPGGSCAECEFAEFGSKEDGIGQACKAMKVIFLLRPNTMIPVVLALPPTSGAVFRKYLTRLSNEQLSFWKVVTKFKLEKATSQGGLVYSKVALEAGDRLPAEMVDSIRSYRSLMEEKLASTKVAEIINDDLA